MKVKEIMHKDPVFCLPTDTLQKAARTMADHDCGAVPVVTGEADMKLIGVLTDRDIACRAVAFGKGPEAKVSAAFTASVASVTPETSLEECLEVMEMRQVRRLPVVDPRGGCRGMVTQAQIARHASERQSAHLLREVSRKNLEPPVETSTGT